MDEGAFRRCIANHPNVIQVNIQVLRSVSPDHDLVHAAWPNFDGDAWFEFASDLRKALGIPRTSAPTDVTQC